MITVFVRLLRPYFIFLLITLLLRDRNWEVQAGSPEDIANTVLFLANSPYITGQIISVDGGRTA
jgi:NAD(P)-dependent dehydrogenase (short-subunit alcohol dehydrogenase family)